MALVLFLKKKKNGLQSCCSSALNPSVLFYKHKNPSHSGKPPKSLVNLPLLFVSVVIISQVSHFTRTGIYFIHKTIVSSRSVRGLDILHLLSGSREWVESAA